MNKLHDVCVDRKESSVVRVRGNNGAEEGLQHQHGGDEALEHVDQGGCLGEVPDDGVLTVYVGVGHQIRWVVGEDGCRVFVEAAGDGYFGRNEF